MSIKVPNYNVTVPFVPDLTLETKRRLSYEGDRGNKLHRVNGSKFETITLPWKPTSKEWVEVYVNNIRLINPRVKSGTMGNTVYEAYNVDGNVITFTQPVTGEITIICDTKATHWWGSLVFSGENVQGQHTLSNVEYFTFDHWPITGGSAKAFTYKIYYKPGPTFMANTYVYVRGCSPSIFNGNHQVITSTAGSVTFRGNTASISTMTGKGSIDGFGNGQIVMRAGISLYSEPVIITQPLHGYARLTGDRKRIAYVPSYGYVGNDTFSWAMINQHGQIGDPKCVVITVKPSI